MVMQTTGTGTSRCEFKSPLAINKPWELGQFTWTLYFSISDGKLIGETRYFINSLSFINSGLS